MYRSCPRRTAVALALLTLTLTLTFTTAPLAARPLPAQAVDTSSTVTVKSFFAPLWELLAGLWTEPTVTPTASTGGGSAGGQGGGGTVSNTGSCIDPMGAPRCQI